MYEFLRRKTTWRPFCVGRGVWGFSYLLKDIGRWCWPEKGLSNSPKKQDPRFTDHSNIVYCSNYAGYVNETPVRLNRDKLRPGIYMIIYMVVIEVQTKRSRVFLCRKSYKIQTRVGWRRRDERILNIQDPCESETVLGFLNPDPAYDDEIILPRLASFRRILTKSNLPLVDHHWFDHVVTGHTREEDLAHPL